VNSFPQNYAYQKYIRKPRYLKVKIPARIGLSPLVVKFGLVWPDLAKKKNCNNCSKIHKYL
jgi:hypothetical protein